MPELTERELQKARLAVEIAKRRSREADGLDWFAFHVFSASFDNFVGGEFVHRITAFLRDNPFNISITGRGHMKSVRLYLKIMYDIFTDEGKGFEAHYFSYNDTMASYHLKKIKALIKLNPFFAALKDNKPTSESIIDYIWRTIPFARPMSIQPHGILSGARGIHAKYIYLDDPFKTEEEGVLLEPTMIKKINNYVLGDLIPMVDKGGYFMVVLTPQSPSDFPFAASVKRRFNVWIEPAIVDEHNKIALWPEYHPYEELIALRDTLGPIRFNREYMAMPVSSANSYIDKERLIELCTIKDSWKLAPHPELDEEIVVGGFDIGKKVHPSHLALFVRRSEGYDENGIEQFQYVQIFSKWMDHWDYSRQIEYLNTICEYFNVSRLSYDDTRAEFQGAAEKGELHSAMEPVVMTKKTIVSGAARMDSLIYQKRVRFINEQRYVTQMLGVNLDLVATETAGNHSDSFYSTLLALNEQATKTPRLISLYDD